LASLAWKLHCAFEDDDFLAEVFPKLLKFFWSWFSPMNDRDRDGIPEWTHLLQTGYEENPMFDTWNPWSQGAEINSMHNPALMAMLYREGQSLIRMAGQLGREAEVRLVDQQMEQLKSGLDEAWNPRTALYRYRDRETGESTSGKVLGRLQGSGTIKLKQTFEPPIRLLIEVQTKSPAARRPQVVISEFVTKGENEVIQGGQFHWHSGGMVATSQQVHEKIGRIQLKGVDAKDKVIVRRPDYTGEDHTLMLPLWAGIPDVQQAQVLISRNVLNADRFDRPYGIPACTTIPNLEADAACSSVYLPWNQLICEGMLAYGFRQEAARLVAHLITGVIQNLKQKRAFYQRYHADTGQGLGERNALSGLAPVGLFLQVLGVQVFSSTCVRLGGKNPFPWPVTVQYKGLKVFRGLDRTEVKFPNGKSVVVNDPAPCLVSL
jgi:Mannosylglycerate hydrolase MGH1-like glycoside hydrolase domain